MSDPSHSTSINLGRLTVWLFIGALLLLGLLAIGVVAKIHKNHRAKKDTQDSAKVSVNYQKITRKNQAKDLVLPGNIQAFQEATLYARSDGYIKSWKSDIGDKVKAGQILAEIETPEIDMQLDQARASLNQSAANLGLAKSSAARYQDALKDHAVSMQANDEQQSGFQARQADFAASQANVARLEKLQGFEHVVAPFDGTVTSRRVDVGSLIASGNTVLYTLAQTDPLRIYVYVPQVNVSSLHEGMLVKVLVTERPGRDYEGKITRLAGAIDPATRTMLIEIQIPNHEGELYAGMYAQMKFSLPPAAPLLIIPASAFVYRPQGPQVATLINGNHVHWQTIQVGTDFGTQMEVLTGLEENASVIVNPNDGIDEGAQVEAKPADVSSNPPTK